MADNKNDCVSSVRTDVIDAGLLMTMWATVVVSSIKAIGVAAPILFIAMAVAAIGRRTSNGILVLLLILYSPAITVGVPNVFAVIVGIVMGKLVVADIPTGRAKVRANYTVSAAAGYVMFITLMTMMAPNVDLAIGYYIKNVEGLVLLIVVGATVASRRDLGSMLMWWAIFAGMATIIKVVHMAYGDDTVLYRTMEALFAKDEFSVEHRAHIMIGGEVARRFLLPGEEPNYTSASLVYPFAIALGFFSVTRTYRRIGWLILACLVAAGLVGTYSRSGFIAAATVVGLYVFRGNPIRAVIPASVLIACLGIAVSMLPSLHNRLFGIDEAIHEGATGRFALWQLAAEMWLESPIYGNGMAAFYDRYHGAVHNTYLQILAETGVIGLALFLLVVAAAFRCGFKIVIATDAWRKNDEMFARILMAGMLGFCVIIGTVTYQDIKLFWLACASLTGMYLVSEKNPAGETGIARVKPARWNIVP